jgi:hypothetical protein
VRNKLEKELKMLNAFIILAQSSNSAEQRAAQSVTVPVNAFWEHIKTVGIPESLMFIAFGIICLFYGWRVFKALTIMAFALIGLIIGMLISQKMGSTNNPILGIMLGIVFGIVAIPMMKWAVGILGAVAGGIITGGLWFAFKLPDQYLWAGTLTGFIAGGMISFIVFKIAVILFTSLGGSIMFATGLMALLFRYSETTVKTQELFLGPKWFIPVIIIVPTIISVYWQNRFAKKSSEWSV